MKKLIATFMAFVLAFGLVPAPAFAQETSPQKNTFSIARQVVKKRKPITVKTAG